MSSILVANRGEIARRVFRTARSMGLRCIAVYTAPDTDAPFVADADEAVFLETSYLDSDAIIAAAKLTGAAIIHPGYGFLSENADFATAVTAAGIAWAGPSPEVIATMGDKIRAKEAAMAAGVPTLPSALDESGADTVGYPLLVKAAAGGGGKGMRVVMKSEELDESVASAKREALKGFGDERVFLERYIARSRHIEIQILGDNHGNLIHLGERECSIQRRHQKIIEEAPSPAINDEQRAAMGDAALRLAESISYSSAGTVEFLVDDATNEFFFLEVNTRLQVEHPVTEEVTGVDLVREQIRVALGEPLSVSQDDIKVSGHSIEARLYAEDPTNNFLPAIGTLDVLRLSEQPEVRWESGVVEGSLVSVNFDPMLAKMIATAPTRAEAAQRLALALERMQLGGVTTNRSFLAATLRHEAFLAGDTTTDFIERHAPAAPAVDLEWAARIGAMWIQASNHRRARLLRPLRSGWRNARTPPQIVQFRLVGTDDEIEVSYQSQRDGSFVIDDTTSAKVFGSSDDNIDVLISGRRISAGVTQVGDMLYVQLPGGTVSLQVLPRFTPPGTTAVDGGFIAPMPGVVLDVRVAPGDKVTTGQTLVILEAMKMEHHMNAPTDGVVAEVRVAAGEQVDNGALLLILEDDSE